MLNAWFLNSIKIGKLDFDSWDYIDYMRFFYRHGQHILEQMSPLDLLQPKFRIWVHCHPNCNSTFLFDAADELAKII